MKIIVIVPARGGSKGIPRKNVRLMNGKPLISYCIETALNSKYCLDVVVSTDNYEIERVAKEYGAKVILRPNELATDSVTLDPVIYHALNHTEELLNKKYNIVITMQPTSPLLRTETLDNAIEYLLENNYDTVLSGINKPHLSWTEKNGKIVPNYEKRLNRQYLPKNLLETGAFFISKREFVTENSRFGNNVSVYEVKENESVDIDSPQDWWIAEKELAKKSILIRVEGFALIGMGHIYRCLLLAYNLIDHEVRFILSAKSDLGISKIAESHFPYDVINEEFEIENLIEKYNCDILINDKLDNDESYIKWCKSFGVRVINFEDLGNGAPYADAVINDLYDKRNNKENHYWGSDYYCIRDEFLLAKQSEFREEAKEVLVIFGGTDPCNLTMKLLKVAEMINGVSKVHFTFIIGMGYQNYEELIGLSKLMKLNVDIIRDVQLMSEFMKKADIAVSSQGRTMLELASMGVPTILLAQNERELHHEFGYLKNGFINLGLGEEVNEVTIKETLLWLINSPQIRKQMNDQMKKSDLKRGLSRVLKIILGNEN